MTKPDRKTPKNTAPDDISAISLALTAEGGNVLTAEGGNVLTAARGTSWEIALNRRFPY